MNTLYDYILARLAPNAALCMRRSSHDHTKNTTSEQEALYFAIGGSLYVFNIKYNEYILLRRAIIFDNIVFLNRKHTWKHKTKNEKKIFFKTQPQPQKNEKREIVKRPFLQSSKNSNRKHPSRCLRVPFLEKRKRKNCGIPRYWLVYATEYFVLQKTHLRFSPTSSNSSIYHQGLALKTLRTFISGNIW
jgi:hypothetical protein